MKARQENKDQEDLPGFLASTKAFESQQVMNSRKNGRNDDSSDEEIDDERRMKIVETRRKFKEKQRLLLESLTKKNRENEKKVSTKVIFECLNLSYSPLL